MNEFVVCCYCWVFLCS